MAVASAAYERKKETERLRQRTIVAAGKDIGKIRNIKDIKRRLSCRSSLERFCLTYNPVPFYRPFSQDHRDAIRRLEEAATAGALYAFAMPRGSGKTILCRLAALWSASYCLRRYACIIGATSSTAERTLDALKKFIRFLPRYREDFPEICQAAEALGNLAQRANGQTSLNESTLIEWSQDRIVLPTVLPPDNWPDDWPLRDDGRVPTSGTIISSHGLTSEGLRGSVITLDTGEALRPDYILLDDPQTPESAKSPAQNETRLRLITEDLLGMAGPGESLSVVMPCTVIRPNDIVDQILDRTKHPLWRGQRTKLMRSMPTNMAAWDNYFDVYKTCSQEELPEVDSEDMSPTEAKVAIMQQAFLRANSYYEEHRAELDDGAECSWPERKAAWDVSAIQHAMHLYFLDPVGFASNYQNQPVIFTGNDLIQLDPNEIAKRQRLPRGTIHKEASTLTASIDVHDNILYWTLVAWHEGFGGSVIDYGTFPRQPRSYFAKNAANPSIADVTNIRTKDGAVYRALELVAEQLLGKEYAQDGAPGMKVQRCLIDAGYKSDLILRFSRESKYANVLVASKGYAITAGKPSVAEWGKKAGERRGDNWVIRSRQVVFDANHWKNEVTEKLLAPTGERSALTLFRADPNVHRLFADHQCAEIRTETFGRGRRCIEFNALPNQDNHWKDGLSLCAVAASIQGISVLAPRPAKGNNKTSVAEEMRKRREEFEARRRYR